MHVSSSVIVCCLISFFLLLLFCFIKIYLNEILFYVTKTLRNSVTVVWYKQFKLEMRTNESSYWGCVCVANHFTELKPPLFFERSCLADGNRTKTAGSTVTFVSVVVERCWCRAQQANTASCVCEWVLCECSRPPRPLFFFLDMAHYYHTETDYLGM